MEKPPARSTEMTAVAEKLRNWFEEHKLSWVGYLVKLLYAESPSLVPQSQGQVMMLLSEGLESAGYRVRHLPGESTGGQLLAVPEKRTRGLPYQVLLGHCDTVWPIDTLDEMPVTAETNRLRGPGVFDMKAGLTMIVHALLALRDLGEEPAVTPVVLITSDEEIGSGESRKIIERLARWSDRTLVLEPSLGVVGKIKTGRKGTGVYGILAEGRAAHAGLAPEEGASAILEMSHVIQELFALNDSSRGITVNVGTVGGGLRSNVIAPDSRAEVDVRVLNQKDAERVDTAINGIRPAIDGVTLQITGGMERPPFENTPRNQALWETYRDLARRIGVELEEGTAGGASDGNYASQFCPTLDGLGAVGHGAHALHEHILVNQTIERNVLLALLLLASPQSAPGARR
jgi:glutamate carboxypeptidase